jgi:hypothetical protein
MAARFDFTNCRDDHAKQHTTETQMVSLELVNMSTTLTSNTMLFDRKILLMSVTDF